LITGTASKVIVPNPFDRLHARLNADALMRTGALRDLLSRLLIERKVVLHPALRRFSSIRRSGNDADRSNQKDITRLKRDLLMFGNRLQVFRRNDQFRERVRDRLPLRFDPGDPIEENTSAGNAARFEPVLDPVLVSSFAGQDVGLFLLKIGSERERVRTLSSPW
jgi:hypothetical protein